MLIKGLGSSTVGRDSEQAELIYSVFYPDISCDTYIRLCINILHKLLPILVTNLSFLLTRKTSIKQIRYKLMCETYKDHNIAKQKQVENHMNYKEYLKLFS